MEDLTAGLGKKHRAKKSGVKADKKVANKKKKLGMESLSFCHSLLLLVSLLIHPLSLIRHSCYPGQSTDRHNPRAFSVSGIVKTKRVQQRNLDKAQKKEVVPLINRLSSVDYPPPALVVIMGPKGCGKSTLIRSLVKIFTGQVSAVAVAVTPTTI